MVKSVEGTIRQIAGDYGHRLTPVDMEDVYSAGRVGAVEAATRYDAFDPRGASFNTYATGWIRSYVGAEVFKFFWGKGRVKLGARTSKLFFQYGKKLRAIESSGEVPTTENLAKALGVPVAILQNVTAAIGPTTSYDETVGRIDRPVADVVPDANAANALEMLCASTGAAQVRAALTRLDERSKFVITERFFEGRTLEEVGATLDLSRERVRQIEALALKVLRHHLRRHVI
jgi:RNA polymerase sigma factor (sigma-70 family)